MELQYVTIWDQVQNNVVKPDNTGPLTGLDNPWIPGNQMLKERITVDKKSLHSHVKIADLIVM